MNQFFTFIVKETRHILRDGYTLTILLIMPMTLLLILGYAISNEVKDTSFVVVDKSQSSFTRRLVERMDANRQFRFAGYVNSDSEIDLAFRQGKCKVALMFPEGTVTDLEKTGKASVQINLDASDPNEATTIESYVQAFITQFQQDESKMPGSAFTINGEVKMLYNPQMKSSYSFVPGLMGMLLMLICCMMTALSIVREKERGTMEILLISPLRPLTIVAAKAIPYFVISLVDVVLIMLVSHFVMGVPVAGNLLTILLVSAMFTLSCLALGLLISTVASDQQIAMMISVVAMMLPTMLLSGVMFPIESLPAFLQILSYIIPARWFIASIREIMIKGMGIDVVWEEVCILLCMTIFLVTVSVKKFKNRL